MGLLHREYLGFSMSSAQCLKVVRHIGCNTAIGCLGGMLFLGDAGSRWIES